jgi:hypothetical protein
MSDWPQWGVNVDDATLCEWLADGGVVHGEPWQLDPKCDIYTSLAVMRDDRPSASVLAVGARPRVGGSALRSPRVVTEAAGAVRNTTWVSAGNPIYHSVCRDMGFSPMERRAQRRLDEYTCLM